jgi:hypothetical protein
MMNQRTEGNIAELALCEQRICCYVLACGALRGHLIVAMRCESSRKAVEDIRS